MRKKAKYILASLLMFCFITTSVNAEDECSYEKQVELNNLAATVKAVYEETGIDSGISYIPEEEGDPDGEIMFPAFKVKILNLSDNIFVNIEGDGLESKSYYNSEVKNSTVELEPRLADDIYKYTIEVRGNVEGCYGEKLRTIELVVPKYNEFSEYDICKDIPGFEYCQKYTTASLEGISMAEFAKRAEDYKKNHKSEIEKNEKKNVIKNVLKNKKVITVLIVIAVLGVATATVLVIRRRSRLI